MDGASTFVSDISGKSFPLAEKVLGTNIRQSILWQIQQKYPDFDQTKCMSIDELTSFRENYISQFLMKEINDLSELEKTVVTSLSSKSVLTSQLIEDTNVELTFGQKIADKVAVFGGSWTFIISFLVFLVLWILLNVYWFSNKGYDPYPFILLNLILSCVAALQAPVIMMSQNRQEEKDRERAKNDYMINLKSELEIRFLHDKIDNFVLHQQQELIEIQKIQIDMINDVLNRLEYNKS